VDHTHGRGKTKLPTKEIDQAEPFRFLMQDAHFRAAQGRRLFAKDMLAGAQGRESDRKMQVIRQAVDDRIDLSVA
jgi:hypothetical protein